MKTERINREPFGECLKLSNGLVEAVITLDVGPRVIAFNAAGGKNLFFEDSGLKIHSEGAEFDARYGKGKAWYIYGGHRMWLSPELMPETYYPDNDRVAYEVKGDTAVFTPGAQAENGFACSISVTLEENAPRLSITHTAKNISDKPQTKAIWALSVAAPGGVAVAPMSAEKTGLLHNRNLSIWEYTNMADSRLKISEKYIVTKQENRAPAVKYGTNNTKGWALYFTNLSANGKTGGLFVKKYSPNHPDGVYPDGGVSFEVYSGEHFLEVETLSELTALAPGLSMAHSETWEAYDNVALPEMSDGAITEFAKNYGLE